MRASPRHLDSSFVALALLHKKTVGVRYWSPPKGRRSDHAPVDAVDGGDELEKGDGSVVRALRRAPLAGGPGAGGMGSVSRPLGDEGCRGGQYGDSWDGAQGDPARAAGRRADD